jgi:HEPN domain-containing protein
MKPDEKREAGRWQEQAGRDIDDARYCLQGRRHNLACFLAQQAAEKSLKAFLYASGGQEPWGHSVADLCREAGDIDGDFRRLHPEVAPLDKFYIPTRYPNGLPGGIPAEAFSEEDARGAIDMAEKVIALVRNRLA